jgi:drug/metabolite transporter (DMT)-like permease
MRGVPTRALWLLAAIAILWGLNWPMMKLALREIGVWQFRTMCVLAGLFWMGGTIAFKKLSLHIPRAQYGRVFICSLGNVLGWNILAAAGLARLPSGRASLLAYSMPLWTVLLSWLILKEKLPASRWFAIALGMSGIGLLLFDEIEVLKNAPLGASLMLASGVVWAFGIVFTKGFPKDIPSQTLVFWQGIVGGLPILIGAIYYGGAWLPASAGAWMGLLFNLTIVFGFCHFAWNEIVRMLPGSVSGVTSLSVPVIGVLSGMWMLGETPRTLDWIALAMLCGAVAMVLYVKPRDG